MPFVGKAATLGFAYKCVFVNWARRWAAPARSIVGHVHGRAGAFVRLRVPDGHGVMAGTAQPPEEVLAGGNFNHVVRVGDTVRRVKTGAWTPAVHALLRHLERAGFDGAPRALGVDDRGR